MAKAPLVGEVKTRLVPPLTASEAAALHVCFLRDMAASIGNVAANDSADGVLVYTPIGSKFAFDGILPDGFKLLPHRGESFGDRLCNAIEDLLRSAYDSVCLINSDSPTLPQSVYDEAIKSLSRPGDRVVLGPADDGGYYLIGLKRVHSNLFDRIAWSTPTVLADTIERAAEIGVSVELLPRWYDVDDGASLNLLCEELFSMHSPDGAYPAHHTREFLASLIANEGSQRIYPTLSQRMTS